MRPLSVLVLAIFMIGPGLHAECLLLCAGADRPATASSCHDEPGGSAALTQAHDCAQSAPALLTAVKRAGADSAGSAAAGAPTAGEVVRCAAPDRPMHGPRGARPVSSRLIPLRI